MTAITQFKSKRGMSVDALIVLSTALTSAPAVFNLSRENAAIGLAALVLVPLVLTWLKTRRLLITDPIIVLGFMWILAVTLPTFATGLYKDRVWYTLSPWSLDVGTLWMYRGWAACSLAYWVARMIFGKRKVGAAGPFDSQLQVLMRRWIGLLGFFGSLIYLVFMGGHTYQILEEAAVADSTPKQIILLFMNLSYVYVFLYFHARGRSETLRFDTIILIAVLAAQSVIFVGSGSKYAMFSIAAAWLLGNAASTSRPAFFKELTVGAAGVCAVFLISYTVAAYRGELASRTLPNADAPVTEVVAFQFDVMTTAISDVLDGKQIGKGYYTDYDNSYIFDRFAHVASFARVLDATHGRPPYENVYASLIVPVFAVLPRALLPQKANFMDSGDFARDYLGWSYGGVSITLPGSLFWAWGYAGLVVGMAAIGAALAWLWARAAGGDSNALIWRIIMFSSVITLLNLGVTFQAVIVPETRLLIMLLILRWGLRVHLRSRHRAARFPRQMV